MSDYDSSDPETGGLRRGRQPLSLDEAAAQFDEDPRNSLTLVIKSDRSVSLCHWLLSPVAKCHRRGVCSRLCRRC